MAAVVPALCGVLAAVAAALAAAPASAQTWPSQNITMVVPYPAGGVPDVIARIIGPPIADRLGKPVVVENRPGASTTVGTASVARAAPDGHTWLLADVAMTVVPNLVAKVGYDHQKDLAPVARLMRSFMTLLVNPGVPARSVAELVALAKARPGELKYGTSGIGSPPHLGALAFIQATGIDMLHVPYRGVALALNDVVGGHIQVVFVSQSVGASQVKANTVRVLGVYGEKRVASLPETPTFRELGLDTRVADQGAWFGMMVPTGTPAPVIERMGVVINEVLADPPIKARLEGADFALTGGTAADLKLLIDQQTDYWREAFKKAGVKPE